MCIRDSTPPGPVGGLCGAHRDQRRGRPDEARQRALGEVRVIVRALAWLVARTPLRLSLIHI